MKISIIMLSLLAGCITLPDKPDKPEPHPPPVEPAPTLPPAHDWTQRPHWSQAKGAPRTLADGVPYVVVWKGAKDADAPGNWRFEYRPPGQPGLYKPEGGQATWFMPRRNVTTGGDLNPSDVGKVGVFDGRTMEWRKWGRWPRDTDQSLRFIDGSNRPTDDNHPSYFFGATIKIRDIKPPASGDWIFAWDIYDQELFRFRVIDRDVIQQ